MNRSTVPRPFLTFAVSLHTLVASHVAAVPPEELSSIRERLTGLGDVSVRAVYRSSKGAGETHVGYSGASGAWYMVTPAYVIGRDDSGRMFWASTNDSESLSEIQFYESVAGMDMGIERHFPSLTLMDLVITRPELIRSVEPGADGNVVLIAPLPAGSRNNSDPNIRDLPLQDFCVEVSADGKVVRTWTDPERAGHPILEFEYSPESPPGFPVSLRDPLSKFELASLEVAPSARDFGPDAAIRLHGLAKYNVQAMLNERAAAKANPGAATSAAPNAPASRTPFAQYRLPLIVVGAVLILGGVLAAWNRHRLSSGPVS